MAVLEATEWIALGFEIIDCVFPDWKFQPADFVASRGLHAALIVGEPVYVEPERHREARQRAVGVHRAAAAGTTSWSRKARRRTRSKARRSASANWARRLKRRGGETLQAGELISTGALTDVAADRRRRHLDRLALGNPAVVADAADFDRDEACFALADQVGPYENASGASGIAAPSCRGSEAPKWTPVPSLITACPCPNVPVRGGITVTSWPSAVSSFLHRFRHQRFDVDVGAAEGRSW